MDHVPLADLESRLDEIRRSPADRGEVKLIVRRPAKSEREMLDEGVLDVAGGLLGDYWRARGSRETEERSAEPRMQLTLMNARVAAVVAGDADRWTLAGDQLFVDLDLSLDNLPAGTRLTTGTALIEITDEPHRGCGKFVARFGKDAMRFVNSSVGRELNLRGVYAKVLVGGVVRTGDVVVKTGAGKI
jgi:hypothetical protein